MAAMAHRRGMGAKGRDREHSASDALGDMVELMAPQESELLRERLPPRQERRTRRKCVQEALRMVQES